MPLSYGEMVARARAEIEEVSVDDLATREPRPLLVDIREVGEFASGVIPGAVLVPRGNLEGAIARIAPDLGTEIVLYCAVGNRSALAAHSLQTMGYGNVSSLAGGIVLWRRSGHPVEIPDAPRGYGQARYARHHVLREIGEVGQQRLLDARVLLIGAGGLGSPVALYLAAAGVGTLGISDPDVVDVTNLQRQVLHDATALGTLKVDSAAERIRRLNDDVEVVPFAEPIQADNALRLMAGYDVVVDGADNFPTRYLLNDASLHLEVPVVHGSIFRWEGQATVFDPYEGPCYRCLFPEPPPPELAPNCAEAGVLGALPGVIGSIQAVETVKLILGLDRTLRGRLLTYDALAQEFGELRVDRDPECPACSDKSAPPALVDYDDACRYAGSTSR
ncbi:MAG TPA: molybdopterin-synthase adenylyltransferase MoeB [Acidimicrobiia bacterium]|nr:molybdopterin-synthase adenylyltransferase MoeB [Acidimicrobiia bacterium]